MTLNDLLNAELYNDNLKMLNQAWEETLLAFGNDLLGRRCPREFVERQVRKSTPIVLNGDREATTH